MHKRQKKKGLSIIPGKAGTIARTQTDPLYMGCKVRRVIDNERVYNYVGFGWVDEGPAVQTDANRFPVVV